MKQAWRKILALALTVVMCTTLFSASVLATEGDLDDTSSPEVAGVADVETDNVEADAEDAEESTTPDNNVVADESSTYDETAEIVVDASEDVKAEEHSEDVLSLEDEYNQEVNLRATISVASEDDASVFDDAVAMTLGVAATATIENGGDMAYFSFTPSESGTYVFYTNEESADTYGYLYDSSYTELAYNDDGGNNTNFLITYELTAGCTYYLVVKYYGASTTGSFSVYVNYYIDSELTAGEYTSTYYVEYGESLTLITNAVTSGSVELTYQWYKSWNEIDGATSLTYVIDSVEAYGYYQCKVSDPYGDYIYFYYDVFVNSGLTADGNCEYEYTVDYGESQTLIANAIANDGVELTYQWYESGSEVEGATTSTYIIDSVETNTYYQCNVSDPYGNCIYFFYYVYVNSGLAADGDNWHEYTVNYGESQTLTANVTVNDGVELTYQWYKSWSEIEGATASTYVIDSVEAYGYYQCEVSDPYGNYIYLYYNVYVDSGLVADGDNWYEYYVTYGESQTLTANATANDGVELTYQWYKSGSAIEGATSSIYTIDSVESYTYYRCKVSDPYGNYIYFYYYVYVDSGLAADGDTWFSYAVDYGESQTLTAAITVNDGVEIAYQWYKSGSAIEEATSSTYIIDSVESYTYYQCEVSDSYGNYIYFYYDVYVNNNLSLSYDSQVTVGYGEDVTLTVNVSADDMEGLTYFWEGYDYTDYIWTEYEEDTGTLTIENVQSGGEYECFVTDKYGNYQWAWFYVSIDSGLTANGDTWYSYTVDCGESQTLTANATANDGVELTYQWYESWSEIEGATTSTYTIGAVEEYGYYQCKVSDPYGNYIYFYYYVYVDSGLGWGDDGNTWTYYVDYGESQTLTANATANDGVELTYQWYKSWEEIEGAAEKTYIIAPVDSYGEYQCVVSDPYGRSIDLYYYVYVNNNFSLSYNSDVKVEYGGEVTLAVVVTADNKDGLTYSWGGYSYEDYNWTSYDETTDELTLSGVQYNGSYECIVTDTYGNCLTAWFYVSIDTGLEATGDTWNSYTVDYGESQILSADVTVNEGVELTYQWYQEILDEDGNYSHTLELDEESSSYTIETVECYEFYWCKVSDPYGNAIYFYYYVYVNNNLSLSYDSQVTVEYGGDVTLTVTVTADDTEGLTYFWEGYDYTDYIWTEYAEDTNTLTLTNVQSNGTYECRVTDKYGNYQWAWFYVSIDSGLMATGDTWNSYTVDYGESQILSADVAVNEGVGLTYQWYQEILDEDGYYSYTLELDEESSNYTIEAVDSYGYYWCVVSDPYGNTLYFYYYVYVNSGLTSGDYTSSYFVEYGGSQELATNASANTGIDLTYQWYQDGNKIEGATSATYIVTDVTSYGFYYCRVSDPYGSSIDFYYYIYVVDFSNAIVMTEGVASVANIQTAGEMAYFSFTPSAGGIYNFYSQEDGEDTYGYLFDSSYNLLTSNDDGGDNLNFRISYTLTAGETYYLVARYYSSDTTGTFSVYVYGDSGLAADGDTWYSYTVEYGESQTLTASATANDGVELTYQWYESWNEIEGATTSTYTIDSVEAYGYYQCRVSDPYGSYIYFYYNVHVNNNLSLSYDSQVAVEYGGDVTLTVTVTANDTEGLTYYWQVYDYTDYTWTEYESTTGTLTLTDVQGKKECDCRVTDKYGNYQWAWFYVSINSGLEVGEYTSEYHVSAGESLTLTTNAVVNEGVDLTYQWYEEVENEEEGYSYWYLTEIDGATESTYNTGAVDSDKYYQCRVFDSYGNTIYFYYSVYVDEDVDYTLGDVNGDGKINTRDIILVSQYLAGLAELSVEKAADVNVDGRINTRDLILISQYVAGLITSF